MREMMSPHTKIQLKARVVSCVFIDFYKVSLPFFSFFSFFSLLLLVDHLGMFRECSSPVTPRNDEFEQWRTFTGINFLGVFSDVLLHTVLIVYGS